MPAPPTALRQIFDRPWLLAVLAAVVSAGLLLAASVGLAVQQMNREESAQMNAQGERFRERLEQVFGELRQGVDTLQAQPLRGCDAAMKTALQEVGLRSRFIYEAAYVDTSQACSNRGGERVIEPQRAADIQGPTYRYWLNTSTEPNDNLAALMLGRGRFLVSTSRGHLTDVVDLPPGGSLLVLLDHGSRAIPVLGPAQQWPPSADWPPRSHSPLLEMSDKLVYRMPTRSPDYQLVLIAPRANQPVRLDGPLWLLFPVSLLLAACIGWLTLQWIERRRSMSSALQQALRRGELQVLYQPIFELASRRCVGAEALVRWHRQDGSLTSPDLFIPMAENTGQIRQITDFVLQRVLEQLGHVLRANRQLYVSVNLAACDVMAPRIGLVAARLLARHRVSATQIAFEVTERGLIDVVVARDNLQALRASGHQVLIDDFGTGYCSLSYLQTLPVDCLKIDKAFIDALGHDAASSGVAPHIIRMAHSLHLRVIAEGIECEAQALLLSSEGVNYGQGWLFAQPLSAQQFIALLARSRPLAAGSS
ncbi:EAL domain-containing protein [Pseudomonas cremoricolorata]|uniref:EAL domain-containing protein n=1 Tax=Pseudomonas cremoricolorata TaxID=157783 RepID=UPI00048C035B|nr:EAL domain-containing protein [Pseudomonas cremoricolorata]